MVAVKQPLFFRTMKNNHSDNWAKQRSFKETDSVGAVIIALPHRQRQDM